MSWELTGNQGTNPATNFLGTTDNQPLSVRTNNAERLRVDANGNVGIGTAGMQGRLTIEHRSVPLAFRETDQPVDQGGLWRMPLDGGVLRFDVNTGAAGQEFGANYRTSLALTKEGHVGIGTLNPQRTLHVEGTTVLGGPDYYSHFPESDNNTIVTGANIIFRDGRPNGWAERMRITNEGCVGIGTSSPQRTLHVEGTTVLGGPDYYSHFPERDNNTIITGANIIFRDGRPKDWIERMRITSDGNVGIGTTAIQGRLTIEHWSVPLAFRETDQAVDDGGLWRMPLDEGMLRFDVNTGPAGQEFGDNYRMVLGMTKEGNVLIDGDIVLTNADCAEDFAVANTEVIDAGAVMVIDSAGMLRESDHAYDKRVVGVISGAGDLKPGITLGKQQSGEKRLPLALIGKVYCKVDAQFGPIEIGDLLTTSPTPGHAMKAADPAKVFGAVIGKALGTLEAGRGLLPMIVALQ